MLAGKSKYNVGTKVEITHIEGEEDQDLVGKTGELTHPFGYSANYVGVRLDEKGVRTGDIVNLSAKDKFKIVD